jgi:hypothetical protein
LQRVGAGLLEDRDRLRGLAAEVGRSLEAPRRQLDAGDIADAGDAAARVGLDADVLELSGVAEAAEGL